MVQNAIDINLPHNFKPRHYQAPIYSAFFKRNIKKFCCPWHRRAGKDKTFLNLLAMAAFQRVGNYIYLFPESTHARKVIWKGIDSQGQRFIDHFPKQLIKGNPNNTEMLIEFINGSTFQLMGSDRYDSLRGMNPVGIVNSEAADHHPAAYDILSPVLAENNGWVVFQGTPKGENHFYDIYMNAIDNESWFTSLLTVNDTRRHDGLPVFSDERIEEERRDGKSEEFIQQEYYCSWTAANVGSYYGKWLKDAAEQKRIFDFEIEPLLPVYTFWDIGVHDATAIWFMQFVGAEMRMVHYYEQCGIGLPEHIKYVRQWGEKNQVRFGDHFAPFDINVKEFGTGRTRLEIARDSGIMFRIAPQLSIMDGIEAARLLLPRVYFNKKECALGLKILKQYHKEYDEKRQCFKGNPAHDFSSHGSDAFRYFAVSWQAYFADQRKGGAIKYKKYQP